MKVLWKAKDVRAGMMVQHADAEEVLMICALTFVSSQRFALVSLSKGEIDMAEQFSEEDLAEELTAQELVPVAMLRGQA
jgi:hypothetical protein